VTAVTETDILTDADAFYTELTTRNRGFVSDDAQRALAGATVLVAGCGSTGGAAVEPLVRLGVRSLLLADNGDFELNNLNRQHAGYSDIGRSKAVVAAERAGSVNPHAELAVSAQGVTEDNVTELVAASDVVIDGVDVTELAGWRAKLLLHQAAARAGKPVITGYDMAGVQYVRFYDYRRPGSRAFDGRIDDEHLRTMGTWAILMRAIPTRYIPLEMIQNGRAHLNEPGYSVPQLVYASLLFGALSARLTVDVLVGNRIRRHILVDAHDVVRTRSGRAAIRVRRVGALLAAAGDIVRLRRGDTARQAD
jgi:hypothetical protein